MPKVNPKRYRTRDVAAAVGLSESLLYSFASKMKRSTRQGRKFAFGEFQKFPLCGNLQWTLGEIAEVLESRRVKRRKRPVSLQMVEEIRAGLICLGFRFEVTEQQVMEPEDAAQDVETKTQEK